MKQFEHSTKQSSPDTRQSGANLCRISASFDPRTLCDQIELYVNALEMKLPRYIPVPEIAGHEGGGRCQKLEVADAGAIEEVAPRAATASSVDADRAERPRRVVVQTDPEIAGSFRIVAFERIGDNKPFSSLQLLSDTCDEQAANCQTASCRTSEVQWERVEQPLWNYSLVGDCRSSA